MLFQILTDLLWRDHKTSGFVEGHLGDLPDRQSPGSRHWCYLFARGKGMSERAREAAVAAKQQTDDYIKQAAGRSPAQEIADAKSLLEAGTISQTEFDALKPRHLG